MAFINLHTHESRNEPDIIEVINQYPDEFSQSRFYSIGIHPWRIAPEKTMEWLDLIAEKAKGENCLAIGECGLDKRIETPIDAQVPVFEKQLLIAQELNKPVIIHCVAAFSEIIAIKKKINISVPMIIHGFSKNAATAKQLLDNGFYLSFGKYLLKNPGLSNVLKLIPDSKFFLETDSISESIAEVYRIAALAKGISDYELQAIVGKNFNTVFGNNNF